MSKSTTRTEAGQATEADTFTAPPDAPETPAPTTGSKRVKYTGSTMHTRVIEGKDFKAVGLEGVGKLEWSLENNHTVDVSDVPDADKVVSFLTESDAFKVEGKPTFKALEPGQL